MIAAIVRYFSGYLDFYISGADIERFLTFCAKNEIELISQNKKGYIINGKILVKDYKKIRRFVRKNGFKIKITKKHGFVFDVRKNRNKIGFAVGSIFIICFVLFMNMFIWQINVSGNKRVEKEEILKCTEKMGLTEGTFSRKHFVQDIEWYILRENSQLSSAEINIQGSIVNILVNEIKEESEMVPDDDMPVNIVASKYGVIRKFDVFDGQEVVKTGDAVMKGDLLVSAVYEDRHNKLTLKHARANVIAETDYNIEVELPLEQKTIQKGKLYKTVYTVSFLGKEFNIGNDRKTEGLPFVKEEKQLCFFWIKLPVNVITMRYFSVKENTVTLNFEEGKAEAFKILEQKEKEEMAEIEIISRKTEEKIKDGKYIINADYVVLMNIAEEQPIESDVPWENTDDIS